MIDAFGRAFVQLGDPRILRLLLVTVILAALIYAGLIAAVVWLVSSTQVTALPWAETLADWGAVLLAVVLVGLLFPGVVAGLLSFWVDAVADAVEARHYPHLGPPRPVPFGETLSTALRLVGKTVAVNTVLLPLYLLLFFVPPLNLALYYGVNGYILGREYFESVALRRMLAPEAAALRAANRGAVWLTGAVTTVLLTVPVLNMAVPVVGTAAMVHIFHKLTRRP